MQKERKNNLSRAKIPAPHGYQMVCPSFFPKIVLKLNLQCSYHFKIKSKFGWTVYNVTLMPQTYIHLQLH